MQVPKITLPKLSVLLFVVALSLHQLFYSSTTNYIFCFFNIQLVLGESYFPVCSERGGDPKSSTSLANLVDQNGKRIRSLELVPEFSRHSDDGYTCVCQINFNFLAILFGNKKKFKVKIYKALKKSLLSNKVRRLVIEYSPKSGQPLHNQKRLKQLKEKIVGLFTVTKVIGLKYCI